MKRFLEILTLLFLFLAIGAVGTMESGVVYLTGDLVRVAIVTFCLLLCSCLAEVTKRAAAGNRRSRDGKQ